MRLVPLPDESGVLAEHPPCSAYSRDRKFVMPTEVEHWCLTMLREKLVKIGAKVVSHGRYVTFQLAEEQRCESSCRS